MNIHILRSLEDAGKAQGLAVIIDVFRAFSTEAFLFANGARKIIPTRTLEEAYELKQESPEYILVGERRGVKPDGFDFGNGPTEVLDVDFSGKTIVHTTENGTKGLMNASNAQVVLAGSFVTADSIVKYIRNAGIEDVYLVSTSPDFEEENEDLMLTYYIRDRLKGLEVDEQEMKNTMLQTSAYAFLVNEADVPQTDFDLCLDFNRFDFVIKKVMENDRFYLTREDVHE